MHCNLGKAHTDIDGNPLFEEVNSRRGNPQEVCAAVAVAIDKKLGESMPLQALVIDAQKE